MIYAISSSAVQLFILWDIAIFFGHPSDSLRASAKMSYNPNMLALMKKRQNSEGIINENSNGASSPGKPKKGPPSGGNTVTTSNAMTDRVKKAILENMKRKRANGTSSPSSASDAEGSDLQHARVGSPKHTQSPPTSNCHSKKKHSRLKKKDEEGNGIDLMSSSDDDKDDEFAAFEEEAEYTNAEELMTKKSKYGEDVIVTRDTYEVPDIRNYAKRWPKKLKEEPTYLRKFQFPEEAANWNHPDKPFVIIGTDRDQVYQPKDVLIVHETKTRTERPQTNEVLVKTTRLILVREGGGKDRKTAEAKATIKLENDIEHWLQVAVTNRNISFKERREVNREVERIIKKYGKTPRANEKLEVILEGIKSTSAVESSDSSSVEEEEEAVGSAEEEEAAVGSAEEDAGDEDNDE
jgi:hypothetical protein